jgi:hypothetical protein
MAFENIPVTSSAIARIEYDKDNSVAQVSFQKGGRSYLLPGIEEDEVLNWASNESPGRYWNSNVKGRY